MRFGLFLGCLLILGSCAQVGDLTGGPTDTIAPQPDTAKMRPLNETRNFHGNEWVIPFDEFISLNTPTETMVVVPPTIKPKASLKGKQLIIRWDEELEANTTYAFYLNGTVQDITEKNDSLMTFVFSTGDFIDSLTYEKQVVDAISGKPMPKYTIALYKEYSDTIRPSYVGQTDRLGMAKLSYLKPGDYQVVAFEDKNRNLKPDIDEGFGFVSEKVNISEFLSDTTLIRAYSPAPRKKINNVQFVGPKSICVSATELGNSELYVDGQKLESYHFYTADSALFYLPQTDSSRFQIVVHSKEYQDTTRLQISNRDKTRAASLKSNKGPVLIPSDSVYFFGSSPIDSLNAEKIYAKYIEDRDTSNANIPYLSVENGRIQYTDYNRSYNQMTLTFEPGSIYFQSGMNLDTIRLSFENKSPDELGVVILHTNQFAGAHVVEMMKDGKVVSTYFFNENGELRVPHVLPGEYSFRVLLDDNNNGKWDRGSIEAMKQPEEYIYFTETKKVRANWELDIELTYAK